MNKKTVAVLGGLFVTGYIVGGVTTAHSIKKTLDQRKKLIVNAIVSVWTKANEDHLTTEEIVAEFDAELEFMKIIGC